MSRHGRRGTQGDQDDQWGPVGAAEYPPDADEPFAPRDYSQGEYGQREYGQARSEWGPNPITTADTGDFPVGGSSLPPASYPRDPRGRRGEDFNWGPDPLGLDTRGPDARGSTRGRAAHPRAPIRGHDAPGFDAPGFDAQGFDARAAAGLTSPGPSPWPPTAGPPSPGRPRRGSPSPGRPRPGSGPPGTRRRPGRLAGRIRREPPRSGRSTATRPGTRTLPRRDASMTGGPGTCRRCPPARCRAPAIPPARSRRCRIRTTCGASLPLARCPPRPGSGRPEATRTRAGVSPATRRPARPGSAPRGYPQHLDWLPGECGAGYPGDDAGYPDNPAAYRPDQDEPAEQPGSAWPGPAQPWHASRFRPGSSGV